MTRSHDHGALFCSEDWVDDWIVRTLNGAVEFVTIGTYFDHDALAHGANNMMSSATLDVPGAKLLRADRSRHFIRNFAHS